jgi:hypothetical protein
MGTQAEPEGAPSINVTQLDSCAVPFYIDQWCSTHNSTDSPDACCGETPSRKFGIVALYRKYQLRCYPNNQLLDILTSGKVLHLGHSVAQYLPY